MDYYIVPVRKVFISKHSILTGKTDQRSLGMHFNFNFQSSSVLTESILGEEVEVNWLVIIAKEEVGMRSDSYKSHPAPTPPKKDQSKVFMILFRHLCLQLWEDLSLQSETKINPAETLSFSKQGWKSS